MPKAIRLPLFYDKLRPSNFYYTTSFPMLTTSSPNYFYYMTTSPMELFNWIKQYQTILWKGILETSIFQRDPIESALFQIEQTCQTSPHSIMAISQKPKIHKNSIRISSLQTDKKKKEKEKMEKRKRKNGSKVVHFNIKRLNCEALSLY